jgi:hypothetical protein
MQLSRELRLRLGVPITAAFEGRSISGEAGWRQCVIEAEDDWKKSKELMGEVRVHTLYFLIPGFEISMGRHESLG